MKLAESRKTFQHGCGTNGRPGQKRRDAIIAGPAIHPGVLVEVNRIDVVLNASPVGGLLPAGIVENRLSPSLGRLGAERPIFIGHNQRGGIYSHRLRHNLRHHTRAVCGDGQQVSPRAENSANVECKDFRMDFGARILPRVCHDLAVQVDTNPLRAGDIEHGDCRRRGKIKVFAKINPVRKCGRRGRRRRRCVPDVVLGEWPVQFRFKPR